MHAITKQVLLIYKKIVWSIKKHLLAHMTHLQLIINVKLFYMGTRKAKISDLVKAPSK